MNTKLFTGAALTTLAALVFCAAPLHKLQPGGSGFLYPEPTEDSTLTCVEPYEVDKPDAVDEPDVVEYDNPIDPRALELVARAIWGEAEGVQSKAEQAAVAWCIFNRVDATGQTIEEVVTAPNQFHGLYRLEGDVPEYFIQLAEDVMLRWRMEQVGHEDVGRTLPKDYLYFIGDGERNHFSKEWKGSDYWDWTLESPY